MPVLGRTPQGLSMKHLTQIDETQYKPKVTLGLLLTAVSTLERNETVHTNRAKIWQTGIRHVSEDR